MWSLQDQISELQRALTRRELQPEMLPPITTTGPRTPEAAAHHASKMKSRAILSPPLLSPEGGGLHPGAGGGPCTIQGE